MLRTNNSATSTITLPQKKRPGRPKKRPIYRKGKRMKPEGQEKAQAKAAEAAAHNFQHDEKLSPSTSTMTMGGPVG